jgi:hypothetical protein
MGEAGRVRIQKRAERSDTLLFGVGPEDELYLGLLIIAAFWALFSGAVVLLNIHEGSQRSAWHWAASFAASSLVAAYYFWRLL